MRWEDTQCIPGCLIVIEPQTRAGYPLTRSKGGPFSMINPPGLSEGAYCFVARSTVNASCFAWWFFFNCTFYLMALYTNKISYLIKHGIKSGGAIKVSVCLCEEEFGVCWVSYLITIRQIHCNKLKQWTIDSQREDRLQQMSHRKL